MILRMRCEGNIACMRGDNKYMQNYTHKTRPWIVDVKNAWSNTATPPYIFMACCVIKYREIFAIC
jgi:hypothetical protein